MRFHEILESESDSDAAELASLYKQRDALLIRWKAIKQTEPKNILGQSSSQWWGDPERGALWPTVIYPLNQKIEQLEAKIKKQKRVALLHTKRGSDTGFDTSEVLYHGTDAAFDTFDRSKVRTAAHLYTSPDIETAESYGKNVYAVYGRQQPQADLSIENEDYKLMRKVYLRGGFKRGWNLSFQEFTDLVTNGELYSYASHSGLQDDVVSTCLDTLKYKSVRITDGKPGGRGFSDSVIFGNADDLQIIERIKD